MDLFGGGCTIVIDIASEEEGIIIIAVVFPVFMMNVRCREVGGVGDGSECAALSYDGRISMCRNAGNLHYEKQNNLNPQRSYFLWCMPVVLVFRL